MPQGLGAICPWAGGIKAVPASGLALPALPQVPPCCKDSRCCHWGPLRSAVHSGHHKGVSSQTETWRQEERGQLSASGGAAPLAKGPENGSSGFRLEGIGEMTDGLGWGQVPVENRDWAGGQIRR